MHRATLFLGIVSLAAPAGLRAQALEVEHNEIGCIVVGEYARMNACFKPAANLARSRVYFRPQGVEAWYYVDMASDAPCHSGVLPKPSDKLLGTRVEYYIEAQDKSFNPARTREYAPLVVRSAQECRKDAAVAPTSPTGPAAVFPGLPAGFGGGIGATTIGLAIAGAGAAVAGTAVALSGDEATTTTAPPTGGVTTTLAPATTTPASTTTTTTPSGNQPPFAVLRTAPDPPSGLTPLAVTFDMCASRDPEGRPLSFFFDYGDGARAPGGCIETHTYRATTFTAKRTAQDTTFEFNGCTSDGVHTACRSRRVEVRLPEPPCDPPTVSIEQPSEGACLSSVDIDTSATATNANRVTFVLLLNESCQAGPFTEQDRQVASGSGTFNATVTASPTSFFNCYRIDATATNTACPRLSATDSVDFLLSPKCDFGNVAARPGAAGWTSQLGVPGGQLQLVFNGASVNYASAGGSYGMTALRKGDNRVEAVLVQGTGQPGTWRFELVGRAAVGPASIRVIAGEATLVTSTAVTFRLKGQPGERVVFEFNRP